MKTKKNNKVKASEMGSNTKLWNIKPLKEQYVDGFRTKASLKVITKVIDEAAYNGILNKTLKSGLIAAGFEDYELEKLKYQEGEMHEIQLVIQCKGSDSRKDAPGQTKLDDLGGDA